MNFNPPKGTDDIFPPASRAWRRALLIWERLAERYGYDLVMGPIFESTEVFARGVGESTEVVQKQMYTFEDKGGRSLTLRPEGTASVVRAYLGSGAQGVAKLAYAGPMFRYERPQAGRYRQHTQFDIESFGEQDPAVDAEVMEVARHLVTDLGFRDLAFQINSTGCPKCRPGYVASLVQHYHAHADQVCDDCKRRLERNPLRVLDCKNKTCQPLIESAPHFVEVLCDECAEHFETLRHYLNVLGRPFAINHRLVRGLDYYTKTVFEVWSKDIGAQSAVFGGGRYDGLMELLGGPSMPGIGFGSGIERLILAMKAQEIEVPTLPQPQVLIASLGSRAKSVGVSLLADLRAAQIPAVIAFGDRSLRSQMREASKQDVRFALILGDQEIERGQVAIRDMQSRDQADVQTIELIAWLREHLSPRSES